MMLCSELTLPSSLMVVEDSCSSLDTDALEEREECEEGWCEPREPRKLPVPEMTCQEPLPTLSWRSRGTATGDVHTWGGDAALAAAREEERCGASPALSLEESLRPLRRRTEPPPFFKEPLEVRDIELK